MLVAGGDDDDEREVELLDSMDGFLRLMARYPFVSPWLSWMWMVMAPGHVRSCLISSFNSFR